MAQPSQFPRGQESARMVAAVRAAMRELADKRVLEGVGPSRASAPSAGDRRRPAAGVKRDRNARWSTSPASSERTPTTGAV
jgi:hypothetical protein